VLYRDISGASYQKENGINATVLVASPGGEGLCQGKAIGENPISPVAPAIANAIYDAVGVRIQA